MANSGVHLVSHHSLLSGLPARVRKKRTHHESFNENGGYTISHDGSQIISDGGFHGQKSKPKRKMKLQTEDQSNPFQLVPCINFGNDRMVIDNNTFEA